MIKIQCISTGFSLMIKLKSYFNRIFKKFEQTFECGWVLSKSFNMSNGLELEFLTTYLIFLFRHLQLLFTHFATLYLMASFYGHVQCF